ncbi:MAG: L-rhamnose mutarotase [Microbacterium sp.]|uniref:L-rhamnose mutarotase n=1 Tax=Microbacterium sp. TaxID=51671 RepID=UPI001ACFE2A5|nr:L-rhamnose mutarotase [Microbacterium sp.]MBN9155134.1 L-rhamnose mutarotase [Microbacterium sp.]MBN9173439.1 L-rhamnose mutarotase [Microbacterium sp.]MBN9182644.1 L-rhamnose mutarotase [Microbacterium sp.]MBN9195282.1 L-rhamnose mutarotase [Microbacterium sp.]
MSRSAEPQRHAFVVGVRPERREEYLELHRAVWPGVEQKLRECHISNYSIYVFGDILFAYFEYTGDDYDADLQRVAEDPVSQEWWTHTDPCQVRIAPERDPGALWQPIDEVWHLS